MGVNLWHGPHHEAEKYITTYFTDFFSNSDSVGFVAPSEFSNVGPNSLELQLPVGVDIILILGCILLLALFLVSRQADMIYFVSMRSLELASDESNDFKNLLHRSLQNRYGVCNQRLTTKFLFLKQSPNHRSGVRN